MSQTTNKPQKAQDITSERSEPVNVCAALTAIGSDASSKKEIYRKSLQLLVEHFDAPYAVLSIENSSGTLERVISKNKQAEGAWERLSRGLLLDTRYRDLPVSKLYRATGVDSSFAAMAVPIREGSRGVVGSAVVVAPCDGKALAKARLSEFLALVTLVSNRVDVPKQKSASAPDGVGQGQQLLAKVGKYDGLHEFAFSLVNGLKSKLGCEQVSIGIVRGRHAKVACISGLDDLYPRSPGVVLVQQAMEECLDAGRILCVQNGGNLQGDTAMTGHLLHKKWHAQSGGAPVASVPLFAADQCVAILSLRAGPSIPLKGEKLDQIQSTVSALMPGMVLTERANRRLLRHTADSIRTVVKSGFGTRPRARKVALALSLLLFAWLVCGKMEFVVTVPCEVVAHETRLCSAPIDGTIKAVVVKPGDTVAANQLLVEFDGRELQLQRKKLESDRSLADLELVQALNDGDHLAATHAEAQREIATAELEYIDYQIAKAEVRAPTAGVVVSADLSSRVGDVVPMGEPLVRLAPQDSWSIELQIPEFAAPYVVAGQDGEFTTIARPDQRQTCRMSRLAPSSTDVDGRAVYVGRASIAKRPDWVRVGMTGVARIDVGRQPVWWIGLHRIIDAAYLYMWEL